MKIYLASRYQDHPLMREWEQKLNEYGHTVTSRWIKGGHEIIADASDDLQRKEFAKEDMQDIIRADAFICRSDPSFFRSGRGGRHVELGVAIAYRKLIILVGERENVFHWLNRVNVFPSFEEALLYLEE